MEFSHCPFICWTTSKKAVNTNFHSLCFHPTGNQTRVYRFSSRPSIHSTTDRCCCCCSSCCMLQWIYFAVVTALLLVLLYLLLNHGLFISLWLNSIQRFFCLSFYCFCCFAFSVVVNAITYSVLFFIVAPALTTAAVLITATILHLINSPHVHQVTLEEGMLACPKKQIYHVKMFAFCLTQNKKNAYCLL